MDTGHIDVPEHDVEEPPTATCDDGVLNGAETDIDCGGPDCEPCEVGSVCQSSRDCENGVCRQGVCAPSTCDDGVLNGAETDIDCGGPACGPCQTGRSCDGSEDCISEECRDGACYLPNCDDVQCGGEELCYRGTCYPTCDGVAACDEGSRCFEGHCAPFECEGVPCHAEESCVRGVCYPPCGAGEEQPCPALDLVTEQTAQVTAEGATLRATIIELPVEPVSDHGFCWHTSSGPSHQTGQCVSLGEAGALGRFTHTLEGLTTGRTYYVRAFVIDQTDTLYANEVSFTTGAPAPSSVTASQGTYAGHVEVSWLAASGATGYVVYRDGVEVGSVGASTLQYDDTEADAPSLPGVPTDLSASRGDHHDHVELSWNPASANDNATHHEYTVVAVYQTSTSSQSAPATGYRGASPVIAYELQIDFGSWFDVGLELGFEDIGAPAGTIEPGAATASAGEYASRVALALSGASKTNGASVSYRARAISALGTGPASLVATGYRGVGELSYQWQRSGADADGGYADLGGATGLSHDDTTAPNDGSGRYYRNHVSAPGAVSQNSTPARGFRAVAPIVSTSSVSNIGAASATLHGVLGTLGSPSASVHGFCYGPTPAPSTDDIAGTVCQSLGAPSQTGAFTFDASALNPGTTYYVRAYAANNAGTVYGDDISFVTPPAAPTGVSATNGTSPNFVRVTWNAAAGADQYRVLRGGAIIATVNATTYDDTDAGGGGLPQAATLSATQGDHTDRVALAWNTPTATNGATHTYTVVAVRDSVAGEESGSDTGYRGPYPITDYELQIDAGQWSSIGLTTSHDDTDAPQGIITAGVASATEGAHAAHVALSLAGAGAADGASRTYRVRAISAAGVGAASSNAMGHRGVGSVSIQWQRSAADSDANFSNLSNATSATHDDATAAADGSARYYRANVTADGAAMQSSNSARGFRAALPAVSTLTPTVNGAQVTLRGDLTVLGAPNPSAHGFCWGTALNPDINEAGDTVCNDLGSAALTGEFSAPPSQTTSNTLYYVRAYATTNAGTAYGANETFEIDWAGVRTFANCSQTGRNGPSQAQCNSAYNGTTLAGEVTVSGGIQRWVVPATGTYRIEAFGAEGGPGGQRDTGKGARMRGDFQLQGGEVILILVGQQGSAISNGGAGGGGGTFIVRQNGNQPLLVAGGGMGSNNHTASGYNFAEGGATDNWGTGGGAVGYSAAVSGGGGFVGNGLGTYGGLSFLNGGTGGAGGGEGGFGGGGGKGGSTLNGACGGGGYSGGAGNNTNGDYSGGGSFNAGSNPSNTGNVRQGHGLVTIDLP